MSTYTEAANDMGPDSVDKTALAVSATIGIHQIYAEKYSMYGLYSLRGSANAQILSVMNLKSTGMRHEPS